MKSFRRSRLIFSLLLAAVSLTGCAAWHGRPKPTSLPVEAINSHSSAIADVRAFETGTRLIVTGNVRQHRGYSLGPGAHVDIQLLDREGKVLAEVSEDIDAVHPRHASVRGNRHPFRAGFPAGAAREASRIRIVARPASHQPQE